MTVISRFLSNGHFGYTVYRIDRSFVKNHDQHDRTNFGTLNDLPIYVTAEKSNMIVLVVSSWLNYWWNDFSETISLPENFFSNSKIEWSRQCNYLPFRLMKMFWTSKDFFFWDFFSIFQANCWAEFMIMNHKLWVIYYDSHAVKNWDNKGSNGDSKTGKHSADNCSKATDDPYSSIYSENGFYQK